MNKKIAEYVQVINFITKAYAKKTKQKKNIRFDPEIIECTIDDQKMFKISNKVINFITKCMNSIKYWPILMDKLHYESYEKLVTRTINC